MTTPTGFGAADYTQALLNLLPRGRIWRRDPDSVMARLLGALAPTYARSTAAATALLVDTLPTTTNNLLPEWEASLGLPDTCVTAPQSIAQRKAAVSARWAARGGQTPAYYIRLAETLGYTITITEHVPARFGLARCGDRFRGVDWAHTWTVNSALDSISVARFGTARFGDRFMAYGNQALECEIRKAAPAHTNVLFLYDASGVDLLGDFTLGVSRLA